IEAPSLEFPQHPAVVRQVYTYSTISRVVVKGTRVPYLCGPEELSFRVRLHKVGIMLPRESRRRKTMIPPEVLLDRFLKSDERRPDDRAVYKGKQDLRALEPSLGSLLANVQDTLNADLHQRGNTVEMERVHTFHFDYVEATRT